MKIYNSNNTEEGCKLFHKYSKVGKYKNISYEEVKKYFDNYKEIYYYDPNILRYQARSINYKLFDTIKLNIPYDKQYYETIKFTSPKIINLDKSLEKTYIENVLEKYFIDNKFKFFILKSPYSTGKSTMIQMICDGIRYERILFITHRQSLARDFMNDFEQLGFMNYLNKANFDVNNDRLIVNIDSLHLIRSEFDYFKQQSMVKQFDLLILDEVCSLFKHFDSPLMETRKDIMYRIFDDLICNTPKIICCDGDISNREYEYIRRYDQHISIYENVYIPRKYNFMFHFDENKVIKMIENDLKNKNKIVVASMSARFCDKLNNHFENKYNILCITSKSDDNIKKILNNLESKIIENNIQILIYSPCITVGTDISIKNYFNKIYGFMCNGSVSARDFNQMLARVRNPIDDTINILLDRTIPKSKIANYYDFDEVRMRYCYENGFNTNDLTKYETLRLWNYFEEINNKHYLFPIFLNMITKKGHTYEIVDEIRTTDFEKSTINEIIQSENIDFETYTDLLKKQKEDGILRREKIAIEKFMYSYKFNYPIENIDEKFMKQHYGKLNVIDNNELFIKFLDKSLDINSLLENNKYDGKILIQKMTHVQKLLENYGFTEINKQVNKEDFEEKNKKITDIINDSFRQTFGMKKEQVDYVINKKKSENGNDNKKQNTNNKKILGFINTLIGEWGLEIHTFKHKNHDKQTKKKINKIIYELRIIDIIKNINKRDIEYELIE